MTNGLISEMDYSMIAPSNNNGLPAAARRKIHRLHLPPIIEENMRQSDSKLREERAGHMNSATPLPERQELSERVVPKHRLGHLHADLSTETFLHDQQ
ncbi:hypothetical protein J6590_013554 [Homalodisca vitripennis]|nr:hypothetical protein J6590_013554 [Homalodisca vitripennis]